MRKATTAPQQGSQRNVNKPYTNTLGVDVTPRLNILIELGFVVCLLGAGVIGEKVIAPQKVKHDQAVAAANNERAINEKRLLDIAKSGTRLQAGEQPVTIPVISIRDTFGDFIKTRSTEPDADDHVRVIKLPTDLTKSTTQIITSSPFIIGRTVGIVPNVETQEVAGLHYELTPLTPREDFPPKTIHISSTQQLPFTEASVRINESEDKTRLQYVLDIQSTNASGPAEACLIASVE